MATATLPLPALTETRNGTHVAASNEAPTATLTTVTPTMAQDWLDTAHPTPAAGVPASAPVALGTLPTPRQPPAQVSPAQERNPPTAITVTGRPVRGVFGVNGD